MSLKIAPTENNTLENIVVAPKKQRKKRSQTRGQAVSARIIEIDKEVEELFEERRSLLSELDAEIAKLQNLRNFKRNPKQTTE